jgi:hypothetical protein
VRPTVIKVAAWGDYHIRSMCENILPCLVQSGNLPGIAQMSETFLAIYVDRACPEEFKPLTDAIDAISGLRTAIIPLRNIPNDPRESRMLLAGTEQESLARARAMDADWFDFQSDTIIDSNFLTTLKGYLTKHNAVFGLPFRSRDILFNEATGGSRKFTAGELYEISLKAMHPVVLNYFMQELPSVIPADPHQFFFSKNGRFVCRSWQPRPYGIYSRAFAEIAMPMTIDTYILTVMDRRKIHVQSCVPGDFYLTALDGESIPTFGSFEVSVDTVVGAIKRFSGGHPDAIRAYVWALKQRCVYYINGQMPVNSANERDVMRKIFKSLEH